MSTVRLALGFSFKPVSFYKALAQTPAACALQSLGSRIHFSMSQLFSAGPTATPRVPAKVLAEWHLPPGTADTEALRTSLFG